MSTKMWKFWSLNKFLRLMAFLTLFYQIISVTISYSGFETFIDMKAISDLKHEPTITGFHEESLSIFEISIPQSLFMLNHFHNSIGCQ
jgi:hypothetical protein